MARRTNRFIYPQPGGEGPPIIVIGPVKPAGHKKSTSMV